MTLRATLVGVRYSGAANITSTQTDPAASLGGVSPEESPNSTGELSQPYRETSINANATVPNQFVWDPTDGASVGIEPTVGEWAAVVNGAGAGGYGRIVSVDTPGTNLVTLDRPLPGLPSNGDDVRFFNTGNLFPNVTAQQAAEGLVDYRMVYGIKKNGGDEDNFRWWINPIQANGVRIEIFPGANPETAPTEGSIANATTSPLTDFGKVSGAGASSTFADGATMNEYLSRGGAAPAWGSAAWGSNEQLGIWIRRTVPAGTQAGECLFSLNQYVDDATTQDATADPADFNIPCLFAFDIAQQEYALSITLDRRAYIDRTAKLIGTVTDGFGNAVEGVNAWFELVSGPGSVATDKTAFTNARGQITTIYTSPSAITVDPVVRLVVQTHPDF